MRVSSEEIDEYEREILASLDERGGEANTSQIRADTGMKNRRANYRFEKLEDKDLVKIEYDGSLTADGKPPMKVLELTETAEEAIEEGLLEGADVVEDVRSVDELREAVESAEKSAEMTRDELQEFKETLNERFVPLLLALERRVARLEMSCEENGINPSNQEVTEAKSGQIRKEAQEIREDLN